MGQKPIRANGTSRMIPSANGKIAPRSGGDTETTISRSISKTATIKHQTNRYPDKAD
jgi:hypothetical protein